MPTAHRGAGWELEGLSWEEMGIFASWVFLKTSAPHLHLAADAGRDAHPDGPIAAAAAELLPRRALDLPR